MIIMNLNAGGTCMANKNKKGYAYIWAVPPNVQFELANTVSAYIEINADFLNNNRDDFKNRELLKKRLYK